MKTASTILRSKTQATKREKNYNESTEPLDKVSQQKPLTLYHMKLSLLDKGIPSQIVSHETILHP